MRSAEPAPPAFESIDMSFTQTALSQMAHECARRIETAATGTGYFDAPYKHIVVDNFFTPELAAECLRRFPAVDAACWEHANDADIEVKLRTTWRSEFDIPDGLVDAVRILNSAPLLRAMGDRLGIPKLIPDPYFAGGGLNVTLPGGLLDVHVDGNYHDATGLNRRINAIVYLNPDWQPGWGGEFGLYDAKGETCLKRVDPLFNRLVVFDSHDFSFHGLPEPLNFPPGTQRRSIILYYYTHAPRPEHQVAVGAPHSALWVKRQLHDKRGNKTRAFS
jgi:hypothetical protein